MTDLTPYLKASGVRIYRGVLGVWFDDGKAKIVCVKAPIIGIDTHLLALCEDVVSDLGLSVSFNSIDTGVHVLGSRHYDGRAVDIDEMQPYGQPALPVSLANPHAVAFVDHLIVNGLTAGHERGPHAAVLFGPVGTKWNETDVPHEHHMHVSVWK